jgi:nucleotide-binding universal stress UspA family protein
LAHVSHKLSNSLEGALAGGGDPATSPLYVFGPFLKLIVVAGVAQITFGASVWLVIFTIAMVSAMYRLVMRWVTDGSGGSGLSEEEFGSWAVKINASITFIEYTLTFLVSMAALVTFVADRFPVMNEQVLGLQYRTVLAILLSVLTGWLVNRGPKMAARAFGPATAAVLLLLWVMVIATIWQYGLHLPGFNLQAFNAENLPYTFGGYARILAVMTGVEIFANLVAAYDGTPEQKSNKAFGSLLIIMGTTVVTMLIVGPAIYGLSDPLNNEVSVFTQTMDQLLPAPLPWVGTIVGIAVLLSACAASAQGLQNLALGLRFRHYIPAVAGRRNRFEVADLPVWIEVGIVALCFLIFGTHEETYLAIYAAGVFILLSMTGWAATKRLIRQLREAHSAGAWAALAGTMMAAMLTTGATFIIFGERFREGAWTYLVMIPVLYAMFTYFRRELGEPTPLEDRVGRLMVERRYLPIYLDEAEMPGEVSLQRILVPLDGSNLAEESLSVTRALSKAYEAQVTLLFVDQQAPRRGLVGRGGPVTLEDATEQEQYLREIVSQLQTAGVNADFELRSGEIASQISSSARAGSDLIVMSTNGRSGLQRLLIGSVANQVIQSSSKPLLLLRPTGDWRSRSTSFHRLLVALDGSEFSERILPYVRTIALLFNSEVILLSVAEGSTSDAYRATMGQYLENLAAELRGSGLEVQARVIAGGPARTIVAVAETEHADLIMLATHGRGGLDRLMLGSVADRVMHHMPCPVFLLPIRDQMDMYS